MVLETGTKRLLRIALVIAISMGSAHAAVNLYYENPMGTEDWHMTGNRLRCGLALTVPNYGVAYFEQYAAKPAHFIMSYWQQVEKPRPATVFVKSPVWKPGGPVFLVARTSIHPGEYAFYLPREPAIKLLNYLSSGYQSSFQYLSAEGFPTSVSLSPIRFQKVYAKYQRCLGRLLPFDYSSVKMSVVLFDKDNYELSEAAKEQLRKVAEYCHADSSVKRVKIAGYTDDTGRKSYNNAVSQDRAETVRDYLLDLGLQEEELSITWYGIKNPVASNDTEAGKAINRRVVVKIIK
jgi:outer membrane protein OmpA-like peptidoglycan-associated protein